MLIGYSVGYVGEFVCAYDYGSEMLFTFDSTGGLVEQEKVEKVDQRVFDLRGTCIEGWNGDIDGYEYYRNGLHETSGPKMQEKYVIPETVRGVKVKSIYGFFQARCSESRNTGNGFAHYPTWCRSD